MKHQECITLDEKLRSALHVRCINFSPKQLDLPQSLRWLQPAPIAVPNSTCLSLSASPACWRYLGQIASLRGALRPSKDLQNMSQAAHLHRRQWPQTPRRILQGFEAAVNVTSIPQVQRAAFVVRDGFEMRPARWFKCLGDQPFHIRRRAQGAKKQKRPEGVMCFSSHLLGSSLPNSQDPLNYDGAEYQNKDTRDIHVSVSQSCVVRVEKAQ